MYKRFAAGIVTAVIGLGALAALGAWTVLLPWLKDEVGGVPKEAVVAFNINDGATCPSGWSHYNSARARVIVGAGDPEKAPGKLKKDENGKALTHYVRGDNGGEELQKLSLNELPPHKHSGTTKTANKVKDLMRVVAHTGTSYAENHFPGYGSGPSYLDKVDAAIPGGKHTHDFVTGTGQGLLGNVFSNMPPYIALYFCKKD
eukprot:Plantae.Rhodophyta-Rhodochaete_pulchella.ctg77899.p1 GENE.Plantae.Rhodophyta-Rhodochaete_pulchella.ctg77899~~Plantae.Rhodophyta-Rhodochaete_pulchella.ctg77899.p1  ORF type:complete len:223 (+),score=23.94 Plantae.Rhodophyta-Rhodochaete_pulchella.ctg77899:64-669(+)